MNVNIIFLLTENEFEPVLFEVLNIFEVLVANGFQIDASKFSPELIRSFRLLRDFQKQNIANTIEIR
jgi:hypothetical protein